MFLISLSRLILFHVPLISLFGAKLLYITIACKYIISLSVSCFYFNLCNVCYTLKLISIKIIFNLGLSCSLFINNSLLNAALPYKTFVIVWNGYLIHIILYQIFIWHTQSSETSRLEKKTLSHNRNFWRTLKYWYYKEF